MRTILYVRVGQGGYKPGDKFTDDGLLATSTTRGFLPLGGVHYKVEVIGRVSVTDEDGQTHSRRRFQVIEECGRPM